MSSSAAAVTETSLGQIPFFLMGWKNSSSLKATAGYNVKSQCILHQQNTITTSQLGLCVFISSLYVIQWTLSVSEMLPVDWLISVGLKLGKSVEILRENLE